MNNKRVNYILVPLCLMVVGFYYLKGCGRHIDKGPDSKILASGVIEKIVVNPYTHKLSIVLPSGTQELFLPDRPSSIEIMRTGKAVVISRQYGTELKPFFGFQCSKAGRLAFGLDLLYFKKLDLGVGVAGQIGNHAPVGFVKASYTVWSNTQAGLTYDTGNRIGGAVTVRF